MSMTKNIFWSDIMEFLSNLNPVYQAGLAGIFTWFCTVIGASCVFL